MPGNASLEQTDGFDFSVKICLPTNIPAKSLGTELAMVSDADIDDILDYHYTLIYPDMKACIFVHYWLWFL